VASPSGARIVLRGACGRRCIQSRQIVGANEFVNDSNEILEALNRNLARMQVGLQVLPLAARLHYPYDTRDVLCNRCRSRPSSRSAR
jgi:hypothetical protein